jgi:hypothetical protein
VSNKKNAGREIASLVKKNEVRGITIIKILGVAITSIKEKD